ncbi:Uncharacterized protein SCF082_LOCUS53415 [Durusdinium trenchii]|uniref:JmjC domain-containing protein n=1 Tax=Durusdinium trenchii TaxID=1381693 RepID=A0ABP0SSK2_9DINO
MADSGAHTRSTSLENDTSNCFIHVVEASEHGGVLTLDLLEACSKGYSVPVLFRGLVPLDGGLTREFLEFDLDQKLLWRQRTDEQPVAFRDKSGKTDYNYVTGREGTAREYLEEIFVHERDVYAHLGHVSSGFDDLDRYPWGGTLFDRIHSEVFGTPWFAITEWELTGTKKWMTQPPRPGDHLTRREELIFPSGGRESPTETRSFDTVYLEPGDVLFNVPFEWHKVLNGRGWSLGAAFRVIDRPYVDELVSSPAVKSNLKLKALNDEYAHLATSLRMASQHHVRSQMSLNTLEMMICAAGRYPFLAAPTR